jgi:hypothetical protein
MLRVLPTHAANVLDRYTACWKLEKFYALSSSGINGFPYDKLRIL